MKRRQLPSGDQVFLDHVAHFVPDIEAAGNMLEALGFSLTPFALQQNQTPSGPVPAGMGNRCIMLRQGYLEFLTAVSGTELAHRFRLAVQRYVGLHLIALSVADSNAAYAQLASHGFDPAPPVDLRRPVEMPEASAAEASFTVLRVPPEKMPEGRVQILAHHSEDVVWQERWLNHDNAVTTLEAVLIVVDDAEEAALRYGRFTGRKAERRGAARFVLALERGLLVFVEAARIADFAPWAGPPPGIPWIAGYALGSADPGLTLERFAAAGVTGLSTARDETAYVLAPVLGGSVTVAGSGAAPSWAG